MKILAIGDFHGKFPKRLEREMKKCDFVLCTGDFANADKIRRIIFKHWTDKKWYEFIGLKRAKQLEKEAFNSGLEILKRLNKIGKKVYTLFGNTDFYKDKTTSEPKSLSPGFYEDEIKKFKNVVLVERRKIKIKGFEVIGHGKYLDVTEFIKNPVDKDKKKREKRLKRYKKDEAELKKLFSKKKPKRDFIFLIHYTPYGIFDKVKFRQSPMYGKHVGFEPYNRIIKKYKPKLIICGHMHEHQGKKRLGDSLIVATGAAYEGKAVVIEFDEKKKRVGKIKFIN